MSVSRRRKKRNFIQIVLIGVGLVLILGALVWTFRVNSPRQTQSSSQSQDSSSQHSEEDTFPEIPRVSLDDAREAFDNSAAVFVDVRDASAYNESHILGALSIPLAEVDERLGELDSSRWIITYCT